MTRLRDGSLYFASDKDLFDLMTSGKRRFTKETLCQHARMRGIFFSREDSRSEVIAYVSVLPHDYQELQFLLELTGSVSKKEKVTSTKVNLELSSVQLQEAIKHVDDERARPRDEVYISSISSDNRLELLIQYTELDFSRTRLRQKRAREAKIEFETTDSGVTIRYPANERSNEIVDAIIRRIEERAGESEASRRIDLTGLTSVVARTKFFTEMITRLRGYRIADVTKVDVDRRMPESWPLEDEDEQGSKDQEESDQMLGVVKKALLQGEGLLQSPEYQSLEEKGFYICEIVWISQDESPSGNRVEFSAGLGDPPSGSGFRYSVRGVYRRKNDGELTKTRRPVAEKERRELHQLLEDSAWSALTLAHEQECNDSNDGET